jgi:exopolyphosphatase/guanosine-5'-triphosphate,3'-diphosphate pyrophosphatase
VRLGCIDIGSNTTRLLVADSDGVHLIWVHQERAFTRIGREGPLIGAAKIAEVVAVVLAQLASAREQGADRVLGVATAAIRSAANGGELVAAIHAASGLEVEVLSEREEARLAFAGVTGTLETACPGELGVVDVGGGSSELVVGTVVGGVRWWSSVPLGSGAISYGCLHSDPPAPGELAAARWQVSAALATVVPPQPGISAAVAVGGSATSLARLAGRLLDAATLTRALGVLAAEPASEIARRFAIDVDRARLLAAGLLILEGVSALFGVPLQVGRGGIREGILLEAAVGSPGC